MLKFKQSKKKVLFVTEPGFSNTGYANYSKELLSRLHNTGKYRIAEFAIFAHINDPRDHEIKWRYYCNEPSPNDEVSKKLYSSDETNRLGKYRFDKVLLDFRPDICCNFKDATMVEYIMYSPLRKFFYEIISPSIDSAPQYNSWLSYYLQADHIIGYTEYALNVLKKETANKAKIGKAAYLGANFDVFRSLPNKSQIKASFGIKPNSYIICMAGRNQIRKLFPELIKAFVIYNKKMQSINPEVAQNTLLLLHLTLPDIRTWDIAKLLVEYNITNYVLFNYICTNCNRFFISKFQDITTSCRFCSGTAILPRVTFNLHQQDLNIVYNVSDVYVQLSNAGAAEIPLIEAAATGCNVLATDYAGMGDIVRRLEGVPIKVLALPRDINVNADRAIPDIEFLAQELVKIFQRPREITIRHGHKISQICRRRFSWDKNAEIWMEAIDSAQLTKSQGRWSDRCSFHLNTQYPTINANWPLSQIMDCFINNILEEPQLHHTFFFDELLKFVNNNIKSNEATLAPFGRNELLQILQNLLQYKNWAESTRLGYSPLNLEDWLAYAETKELCNL